MRSRATSTWTIALVAALSIVLVGALPSAATPPPTLDSSRVLDSAGVLDADEEQAIETRLEALSDSSNVDLWVVYVDRFTEPTDAEEWATIAAENNNLGPNQYLLAIATEGRAMYLSGDSRGPVSFEQILEIEQELIGPALRTDDWVGGAMAAADGLADAAGGGGGAAGGWGLGGILFALLLAAVVGAIIWLVVRARRRGAPAVKSGGAATQVSTDELAREAASALVQTDDAIKTSAQELEFARAQFGDAAAAEFQAALAQAKADLDAAFSLQQQLDDSTPDSESDVRAWNTQIIDLCARANAELDAKADAFDQLRQLEQNAPESLDRIEQQRDAAAERAAAAADRLTAMRELYADAALVTVADNPEQVDQRLTFAAEQLTAARASIGAGDGSAAAVSLRAAEEAVAQALALEAAVARLGDDLVESEKDAAALIADLEKDLAAAAALPDTDGRLAGATAATRQRIETARPLLAATDRDPMRALETLEAANAEIDALLAGVRDEQERQQRAAAQLQQLLTHAQAQVSAAEDFITSRRGAVGATARTRLAEAGAVIVQARQVSTSDPAQALAHAQRANDLAAQAIRQAQNDVGAFGGGGFGGGGGGGGNVAGAVLGGILINSMLGGGGTRGGGGGRTPSLRPTGGSRGGGMSSGSFGGGGTRSRRGGGRF